MPLAYLLLTNQEPGDNMGIAAGAGSEQMEPFEKRFHLLCLGRTFRMTKAQQGHLRQAREGSSQR